MDETIEINGHQYQVSGYAEDGLPIIKAQATQTQEGFDEDGNPIVNVNVTVPAAIIGVTPGKVE